MASLYLDNDVDVALAPALQAHGHSATTSVTLGMRDAPDAAQLLLAVKRGWILVTHNRDDFAVLHDAWHLWTADWNIALQHPGVLVIPHKSGDYWNVEQAARELDNFIRQQPAIINEFYEFRRNTGWGRRE